jgi:uroporphyrinogen III methyltransferase/synthase
VLLLRALVARDALPEALREAGCTVDVVPVYETKPASAEAGASLAEQLEAGRIDAVTLTSSSTATHLVALLGARAADLLGKTRVASIGPITTETAMRLGIRVDVTADPFTVPCLIESLERSFETP